MEDAKRKEIETRLRELIAAADDNTKTQELSGFRTSGNTRVIRRRKGRPDYHITANRAESGPVSADMG